jgi:hypothetical protein
MKPDNTKNGNNAGTTEPAQSFIPVFAASAVSVGKATSPAAKSKSPE